MNDPFKFEKYIESLGFYYDDDGFYAYKNYKIQIYEDCYYFLNRTKWFNEIDLNDLTPLKQIIRSYKLKKILK